MHLDVPFRMLVGGYTLVLRDCDGFVHPATASVTTIESYTYSYLIN